MQEPDPNKPHFKFLAKAILERSVIPFLGAGANLCDRSESEIDEEWDLSQNEHLPSGKQLTRYLASEYFYPATDNERQELTRVSQYAAVYAGLGSLYEKLHGIFNKNYQLTSLHQFIAKLPSFLRAKAQNNSDDQAQQGITDNTRERLVVVTTNYDDLLERAFDEAGEQYHKFVYVADKIEIPSIEALPGSFIHWTPDGQPSLVEVANTYNGIADYERRRNTERYPTIIKIHGAVDRIERPESDPKSSYVITEDHYIDYLTNSLPASIVAALKRNHFLFLGYSLRDWNLRVILRRIWREQKPFTSWAVQKDADAIDKMYWRNWNVEIIPMALKDYIESLESYMGRKP